MTAHSRPEYLAQTLACWTQVRGLTSLHISLDDSFAHEDEYQTALDMTADFEGRGIELQITRHDHRKGVLRHPYDLLAYEFSRPGTDFVVLAEEDVLPSTDVIEYMTWCRDNFLNQSVLAACAFTKEAGPTDEVVLLDRFSVLMWGTWKDRWQKHLRPTWDLDYSSGVDGGPSGWDWNITLRVMKNANMLCAHPRASRSQHIGQYGGAHMQPHQHEEHLSPSYEWKRPPFTPFHLTP
jgi:hypothetical protein